MELKKNPKKDLNRNSGMYFATGLLLVLMLSYVALEWKSFYGKDYVADGQTQEELWEQAPPMTFVTPPPPPPPPVAPPVLEIVDNEAEVEEVVIASTESGEEKEVIEVEEVIYEEVEEEVEVIWRTIEEVPVFPGCENYQDKRACFQKMMNKHISKAFKYPEMAQEMGIQGKVFTQFTIQKDGTISEIKLKGPHQILEKEAGRIIGKLPQMKPGKQRDKNVKVAFTVPINFRLN